MIYGNDTLMLRIEGNAVRQSNGDYAQSEWRWSEPIQCDAYPSGGKADVITLPDGVAARYAYEVHLDVEAGPFKYGDVVSLTTKDGQAEYTVKGYHCFSFIAKLWL